MMMAVVAAAGAHARFGDTCGYGRSFAAVES
jgi:hypothetical protein